MYSWLPACPKTSLALTTDPLPTSAVGRVSGLTMKYPEAGCTPGVGLALAVPEIGVVTWKVYLPKLASAPCPGTEKIGISSNPLERGVNVVVCWAPPGVVITRVDGTDVLSPEKHRFSSTNLWIIKTFPELPAAGVIHVGGCNVLPKRPAITEFGRYGLAGWVEMLDPVVTCGYGEPDAEVPPWPWLGDPVVTWGDDGPDVEVPPWAWLGDPGVAAESGALESVGAEEPFKALLPAQPASVMLAMHTTASAPVADRKEFW